MKKEVTFKDDNDDDGQAAAAGDDDYDVADDLDPRGHSTSTRCEPTGACMMKCHT